MTAKEEGLWHPICNVTHEEIKHMQARTDLYRATHPVGEKSEDFDHSPDCATSWCRWVVVDSVAFAAREGPRNFPGGAIRQSRRPAPLPALGSTQDPNQSEGRRGVLSTEQRERVARKKAEALQRKLEKKREQEIAVLAEPDEEDDPFGLGTAIGG
jgi:hypothetical protein